MTQSPKLISEFEGAVLTQAGAHVLAETSKLCESKLEMFSEEYSDELSRNADSLIKCGQWARQLVDLVHGPLDGISACLRWPAELEDQVTSLRRLLSAFVAEIEDALGILGGRIWNPLPAGREEGECDKRLKLAASHAKKHLKHCRIMVDMCQKRLISAKKELDSLRSQLLR